MSSPSNTDWVQFYQLSLAGEGPSHGSSTTNLADATVVTTTITTANTANTATSVNSGGGQLSPEGRVTKPARRRRASRAAPTTLLNTDTTNFRAMVQQFTGVPTAPFTFGTQISAPNLSFGLAQQHQNVAMVPPPPPPPHSYYTTRYLQQQQQQQQYNSTYNRQQQFVFPFNNSGGDHHGYHGHDQSSGLSNNLRPNNMEVSSDGFLMEGNHQLFHGSSSSSASGINNRSSTSGYNL